MGSLVENVIAACGNVEDSFEWEILGNLSVVTCGG
jgi:hypothetical protein